MTPNRFFKYALDKFQRPSGGAQIDSSWVDTTTLVGPQGPIAGAVVNPAGVSVVDFSIPAGVRRLTLLSRGLIVPTGSIVRLGTSSGLLTTGYNSVLHYFAWTIGVEASSTVGLLAPKCNGVTGFCMTFHRVSPNAWNFTGQCMESTNYGQLASGSVQLPGELTTFRYVSASTISSASLELLWEF